MCREVIAKASCGLDHHFERFFRPEFGHGKVQLMYELFTELNKIVPQNLICFLLQLDSKLQSKDDDVRLEVSDFILVDFLHFGIEIELHCIEWRN